MIFLVNKVRLVQIRDGMAMGIKRASEWAGWCILIWSSKQSIEKLSMCHQYVPSLSQNAFYVLLRHSTVVESIHLSFTFFPLDSKQKTGIQISPISRGDESLSITLRRKNFVMTCRLQSTWKIEIMGNEVSVSYVRKVKIWVLMHANFENFENFQIYASYQARAPV